MARKILVADRDPIYAQALARRIQRHSPTCDVTAVSDEQAFQDQLSRAAGDLSLVVSAAHFPVDSLPAGISQLILLDTRIESEDLASPTRPVRLGPVQPILERLDLGERSTRPTGCQDQGLAGQMASAADKKPTADADTALSSAAGLASKSDTGGASAAGCASQPGDGNALQTGSGGTPPARAGSLPDKAVVTALAQPERPRRIILILTQTVNGRQPTYVDQRCQLLAQEGERIVYLPLMPSVYCRQAPVAAPGSSPGLTDLLLRADSGGLKPADLGAYMAVDRLGRMQVRPADRADDLFECRPHTLFQLVALLRERVLGESQSRLVVEAAGIPFRSIQAILPLFEAVEVILPDDSGFAGQALRREISDALKALADGARLVQVPEPMLRQDLMGGKPAPSGMERTDHVPA